MRIPSWALLCAVTAVTACSKQKKTSFETQANATATTAVVTRYEQVDGAQPKLTVTAREGALLDAFRAELEAQGVGKQGGVEIALQLDPPNPDADGSLTYIATYQAKWLHAPQVTSLSGARTVVVDYAFDDVAALGKAMAAYEAAWINAQRPAEVAHEVAAAPPATQVELALKRGCSLHQDGSVRCWADDMLPLFPIAGVDGAVQVVVDQHRACARDEAGKVSCWGQNPPHVVNEQIYEAADVCGMDDAVDIALGQNLCAVTKAGKLLCWPHLKQAMDCQGKPHEVPVSGAKAVAMSFWRTVILREGGEVVWLETSNLAREEVAADAVHAVELPRRAKAVTAGLAHMCALLEAGVDSPEEAWCWSSKTGEAERFAPGVQVSAGFQHSCSRDSAGAIYCWGLPKGGRGPIAELPSAIDVVAGSKESCIVAKDGQVHCWKVAGDGLTAKPQRVRTSL